MVLEELASHLVSRFLIRRMLYGKMVAGSVRGYRSCNRQSSLSEGFFVEKKGKVSLENPSVT